jgi:RHS repeat-associated protein
LRAEFDYWPTGQVKTKRLGLGPAQTVDYKYNARDWLVSINDGQADTLATGSGDHVGLELSYALGGCTGLGGMYPEAYYNGNVASYQLRISDPSVTGQVRTSYQSFGYDPLDRLAAEKFTGNTRPSVADTLRMYSYDRNSNLQVVYGGRSWLAVREWYEYYAGTNRLSYKCDSGSTNVNTFLYTPSGSISRYTGDGIDLRYNESEQLAMRAMLGAAYRDSVMYWYNTSGQRIAKRFDYADMLYCWAEGDSTGIEDGEELNLLMMGSGGSTEDTLGAVAPAEGVADSSLVLSEEVAGGGLMMMSSGGGGGGGTGYWYPCPEPGSVTTGYYYLGNDLLFDYHKLDTSGQLIGNYVYVNGERLAKFRDLSGYDDVEYYLSDHQGSVVATVDKSGSVTSRNVYRPWGEMLNSQTTRANNFRYTGQYLDEDLSRDLAYYGQRYYDPRLRIFTSPDALYYKDPATGSYVYCRNNPVKYVDPDGESLIDTRTPLSEDASVLQKVVRVLFDPAGSIPSGACVAGPGKTALQGAANKLASKIDDALAAMKRGLSNEGKVLESEGLASNKAMLKGLDPKTGLQGNTMPDAIRADKQLVEVKDVKYLKDSKQLRVQNDISMKNSGTAVQIITGSGTKVSETVAKRYNVKPIDWIGPQQ